MGFYNELSIFSEITIGELTFFYTGYSSVFSSFIYSVFV